MRANNFIIAFITSRFKSDFILLVIFRYTWLTHLLTLRYRNFGGRATRAVTGLSSGDSGPPRYQLTEPMWCCRTRPNKILLVHGLEHMRPAVNCDRVFNLFCLYGNVSTVKILKDDKVLVELEDVEAAKRCVSNLHLLPLNEDGHKMKVKWVEFKFDIFSLPF